MSELDVPSRRIDKGVKRGPRLKPGRKPRSPRRNNGDFLPILSNDPEAIKKALEDYSKGATLEQLARKHKVTRQAIYGWLLGDLGGEQHSSLVTQSLTARIASADHLLDTGDNALDVQRGREQARFARMDYERRRPHLYGQKQEIVIDDKRDLGERLRRARERVIEGTVVSVTQDALQQTVDNPVPVAQQIIGSDNAVAHQDDA
jgi:hypothetical protein